MSLIIDCADRKDIFCKIQIGLRSSALICQRTTKAVVHIFNRPGFSADVYLDDFYGAEYQSLASQAFSQLGQLFQQLGLDSSPKTRHLRPP